ncbi:hypothetical protein PV325_013121 [Microctonus aethiopoides]|nr:hypothetical protein PV325_013121 [Microctonus aethiopoides]KAK0098338.1 hypothetical protein PV326_009391 [Microctonus aethiopoides]
MTGLGAVNADPDAMARPTRPKVFTSVDELRRYLDLIRDYYSLSGKARYGKRADMIQARIDSPTYFKHGNFFAETIGDDLDDKQGHNKILKQSSESFIPEWQNIIKMLSINRQEKSHGNQ